MKHLRVLLLINQVPANWSTRESMQLCLVRALAANGATVVLAYPAVPERSCASRMTSGGATIEVLNSEEVFPKVWANMRRLQDKYGFQIFHSRFCNHWNPVHWCARLAGIPLIVFTEATGGIVRAAGIKLALLKLRAWAMTSPIDRVISVSEFAKSRLRLLGIPEMKLRTIYNAVDRNSYVLSEDERCEFLRTVFGEVPHEPVVATACYFNPSKRVGVLIRAASALRARRSRFKLMICGDGPLRRELEGLVQQLKLSDIVKFPGWISKPRFVMGSCDIFVLPSVGEAFGNVIVEAMAASRPVVATRGSAFLELVQPGVTGFLAPEDDPFALAQSLQLLIDDGELRRSMGMRARAESERFSLDTVTEQTVSVYKELLINVASTRGSSVAWTN